LARLPQNNIMPLNIVKLCVGCESIADLESWIEDNRLLAKRLGRHYEQYHTTRMFPRRIGEDPKGGSLYWVIKGQVAARQQMLAIRPFTDAMGINRCHLVLEPVVHPVRPRPLKAFQGWRYLEDKDAPPDLARGASGSADLPESMRKELAELGLL
jgi:hypothetical protein